MKRRDTLREGSDHVSTNVEKERKLGGQRRGQSNRWRMLLAYRISPSPAVNQRLSGEGDVYALKSPVISGGDYVSILGMHSSTRAKKPEAGMSTRKEKKKIAGAFHLVQEHSSLRRWSADF